MSAPLHLAILALLAAGAPAMAQPLEPDQASLLEQARQTALRYSASLPDFLCTEMVRRTQDPMGVGRWVSRDWLTVKLSYFEHKEDYRLMEIDGKPTSMEYQSVRGAVSMGEFGTQLYALFHPESHGDFGWKGWSTLRKRRVARFSYRIARERSIYRIQYGLVPAGPNGIVVAYHGDVYVDAETHMALRFTLRAEMPEGFPINSLDSTVDYEFAAVGGKQYLLPSHAYVRSQEGRFVSGNSVEFREYRKFQSESTLTFDPPPGKK